MSSSYISQDGHVGFDAETAVAGVGTALLGAVVDVTVSRFPYVWTELQSSTPADPLGQFLWPSVSILPSLILPTLQLLDANAYSSLVKNAIVVGLIMGSTGGLYAKSQNKLYVRRTGNPVENGFGKDRILLAGFAATALALVAPVVPVVKDIVEPVLPSLPLGAKALVAAGGLAACYAGHKLVHAARSPS